MIMSQCSSCQAYKNCFAALLTNTEKTQIEKIVRIKKFKRGDIVFSEDHPAKNIYILINGDTKLQHKDDLDRFITLRIAHSGETLGLETMLPNSHYLVSAVAESDITCCLVSQTDLDNIVLQNNDACAFLLQKKQNEIERIYKHSLIMISGSSLAKLALALLSLNDGEGRVISTKEEIALMTGLSRESISRMLSQLKMSKLIEARKREIILLSLVELKKLTKVKKKKLG